MHGGQAAWEVSVRDSHGGLTKLVFHAEGLSNAAVAALAAHCPSLKGLALQAGNVTDAGVDALIGMGSLRSVGLGKTKVSKKGISRLRAARPDLHVSTYA